MGSAGGARGVWGYVEGGMGALTRALAESAKERRVEILTEASVGKIDVSSGETVGVQLRTAGDSPRGGSPPMPMRT